MRLEQGWIFVVVFFSISTTLYKGYMNSPANSSMYPSFFTLSADCLHLDLVLVAIGVHLEVFQAVMCKPGVPSTTLKHTH